MKEVYGLIGYPLEHSFSAQYFADKFRREGIANVVYLNFPIADIGSLEEVLRDNPSLRGFNVTSPYKEQIIPYLDTVDQVAADVGAVNCVRVRDGKLEGHNTDVYGFGASLDRFIGNERPDALILGTGGASNAAAYVLERKGLKYRKVSRRGMPGTLRYEELADGILSEIGLIINATPLGTYPDIDSFPPVPYELLSARHYLFDMAYNPPETVFLAKGRQRGCMTVNGLGMLALQAERSWEIWNR